MGMGMAGGGGWPPSAQPTQGADVSQLKAQADALKQQLDQIQRTIEELEKKGKR